MLESLSFLQLLMATVILLLAYIVRGITGFGSGLIAIPLLALMLPLSLVVPLVGLLDYIASVSHGLSQRRQILWHEIMPLLPFTLIGVIAALYLFTQVDSYILTQVLGVFILLYALYSLSGYLPKWQTGRVWAAPVGLMGSMVGTLFGTGGPFYVIYLQLRGLNKTAFRATIATIFLLDGASRIVGYTIAGFYTRDTLIMMMAGLPLMFIAMFIGGRIHTDITPEHFKKIIGYILIGSGLSLLLR